MMGIKSILQLLLALGTLCVASFGVPGAAGCSVEDQKALLAFKAQFNDPTGILKSWDPIQPDCCWWKGVRCEFQAPGRVSSLSLQPSSPSETGVLTVRKGVKGVGSSLGDLTALTFLVLAQVRFSFQHPVPATLAKLQNLQTLGLIGTQCIGPTVPCFLSTLPKLNDVTITGNRFPNGIPVSPKTYTFPSRLLSPRDSPSLMLVRCSGLVWKHEGVGVAVSRVEWNEDAGDIRLQPHEADEAQQLLGGRERHPGPHSAVGGCACAHADARQGHLPAEQQLHRAHSQEPEQPVRGELPARQPWPLRTAACTLPLALGLSLTSRIAL